MVQVLEHPGWTSFWRWLGGTVVSPSRTLRDVVQADGWPQALALVLAIAAFEAVFRLSALAIDLVTRPLNATGYGHVPWWAVGPASPYVAASSALGAVTSIPAGWAAGSVIYYLLAMLFGGRGRFTGLWAALGFASLPGLLFVPVMGALEVAALLGPVAVILVGLLAVAVAIPLVVWTCVLQVIAVREAMSLSSGRAALTVLIPSGVLLLIALFVGCMILAVLIAIHAGQPIPSTAPSV